MSRILFVGHPEQLNGEEAGRLPNSSCVFSAIELFVVDEGDLLEVIAPDVLSHVVTIYVFEIVPDVEARILWTSDEGTVSSEDET